MTDQSLKNKVIFITGASRGIGKAIALKCAKDGAKIVVAAKTASPHPTLEGTIYTTADEIEKAGGTALPLIVDVRHEDQVQAAIEKAAQAFGGIDILINNASAINLSSAEVITMKQFDLIFAVNVRGTFLCAKLCLPYLKQSANPHILTLSPPLNMHQKWFKNHLAYTLSKYGMSMCTLGLAEEFKPAGIAVNSLWPKTIIATAAIAVNFPPALYQASRKPDIMADAAYEILLANSREVTGQFFIDEELLACKGIQDFSCYSLNPNVKLFPDLYVEPGL